MVENAMDVLGIVLDVVQVIASLTLTVCLILDIKERRREK